MYSLNTRKRSSNTKFVRRFKSCTQRLLSNRIVESLLSSFPCAELPERLRGSTRSLHLFFLATRTREKKKFSKKKEKNHPHRVTFLRTNYTFTHTLRQEKGTISHSHSAACTTFDRDFNPFARFAVRVWWSVYCREFAFRFLPRKKRTKILCASSSSGGGA